MKINSSTLKSAINESRSDEFVTAKTRQAAKPQTGLHPSSLARALVLWYTENVSKWRLRP